MSDLMWARENLPLHITTLDAVVHCAFSDEDRIYFSPLLRERYCCAGISDCAVSVDGELRPCIMAIESGGNILEDGWELSWQNLAGWKSSEILPPECLQCAAVAACGGGCRSAARAIGGHYNSRDPYMTGPLAPIQTLPASRPVGTMNFLRPNDLLESAGDLEWRVEDFGRLSP
jgi:radical SAM protein with 4Fe4S-binding SPASM domain